MKKVFSDFCLILKIISFPLIFQMTLNITYAQQHFSVFVNPGGVKQYTYFSTLDSAVHVDYSNDGSYNIGREGGAVHPFSIWRSYGTITSLGLPRDAKIDKYLHLLQNQLAV